jgi:hypothetical protein
MDDTINIIQQDKPKTYLGLIDNNIIRHFNSFKTFDYLTGVKMVNSKSLNGTIYNVKFKKENISASVLIKTANKSHSDNLYYEYLVGTLFINKMCKLLPCFIHTHHILTKEDRNILKKNNINDQLTYLTDMNENELDDKMIDYVKTSCNNSAQIALMMQYIDSYETFHSYIQKSLSDAEIQQILFQVYCPLSHLQQKFTHYDLHGNNVLLSKLPNRTYVQMKYVFRDREAIEFKSSHIVKIIDYGRSYFYVNANTNSIVIGNKVLETRECLRTLSNPKGAGYNFMKCNHLDRDHYICSRVHNISHDLKLVAQYSKYEDANSELLFIANKIIYLHQNGTREIVDDSEFISEEEIGKIYNINIMAQYLYDTIDSKMFVEDNNNDYKNKKCIGLLTIYVDGSNKEMEFIST